MFVKGACVGAWIIGLGMALVVALPVFGLIFTVLGWVLKAGKNGGD